MTVDFYSVTDANNVVNKTIDPLTVKSVTNVDVFNPSTLENPQLVLTNFDGIANKNYCYIAKYGRYYYVTGVTFTSAGRVVVNCAVDVLKTYAADIIKCKGTAVRSESVGMNYITDNRYPTNDIHRTIDMLRYPKTPFTRTPLKPYILTTIGGSN